MCQKKSIFIASVIVVMVSKVTNGEYWKFYRKKRKGILGKTIVSVLTIFLLIFGNMIAKEADIPVNMLFLIMLWCMT